MITPSTMLTIAEVRGADNALADVDDDLVG
jgi:hypothetical protein